MEKQSQIANYRRRTLTRRQGCVYLIGHSIYAIYFHPLSRYPGPKIAAISPIALLVWEIRGKVHSKVKHLHDRYGDVVRIGPNALVYRAPRAWKEIYGYRTKKGQRTFQKESFPLCPDTQWRARNNYSGRVRSYSHAAAPRPCILRQSLTGAGIATALLCRSPRPKAARESQSFALGGRRYRQVVQLHHV